jgi:hypothetical protein
MKRRITYEMRERKNEVTEREIYVSVQKSGSSGKTRTYKRNEREYQDERKKLKKGHKSTVKVN